VAVGLTGIVLLATAPAGGQPRDVVAVEGAAEGLFFDLDIVATPPREEGDAVVPPGAGVEPQGAASVGFGPAPVVVVGPQSGAGTDFLLDIAIQTGPFPPFTAERAEVSTEGVTGSGGLTRSSSRILDFDFGGIAGDRATSECEATTAGVAGSTNFVNATLGVSDPAPNTVITKAEQPVLSANITIILNEQEVVASPLGQRIEVTALHVLAAPSSAPDTQFVGEFYIGRSVCGVSLAPVAVVVEPTFTG